MSLFTKIIDAAGMGKRADLNPPSESQAGYAAPPHVQSPVIPSATAAVRTSPPAPSEHDAVMASIDGAIEQFVSGKVPQHLRIAVDDAFFLERINIAPLSHQAQLQLARFLEEFQSNALRNYVARMLGGSHRSRIVMDSFSGIHALAFNTPASTNDFGSDDAFAAILANPAGQPLRVSTQPAVFEITLVGRWAEKPNHPVADNSNSNPGELVPTEQVTGPTLRVTVWDAHEPTTGRSLELDRYPVLLCRAHATATSTDASTESTTLFIAGAFMSAKHAVLELDGSSLQVRDLQSRNGLWHNANRLAPAKAQPLSIGDLLRFSSADDRDAGQYPRLRIDMIGTLNGIAVSGATPVVILKNGLSASIATPISNSIPTVVVPSKVLAQLSIVDESGRKQIDITQLPFSIGRNTNQDYVVPAGNAGVSREHLNITAISDNSASVENLASNAHGTGIDPINTTHFGAQFEWPFEQEIQLAAGYKKAPAVRIALRKVA